tara:strand:- start:133 stop:696 length:564 start_codon:yes stop_codon:yes gene_type:complete
MRTQNLIIYKFAPLYLILKELNIDFNFAIIYIDNDKLLVEKISLLKNYLIISNKKNLNNSNLIFIEKFPINIFNLIEKININFLKLQFNNQSQIKIKEHIIDLNSREMILNKVNLKLTEKEINTIIYLSRENKPVSINELQKNVWGYLSNIETHTVETHIYRLRKKILKTFNDNDFIVSKKDGYQIK